MASVLVRRLCEVCDVTSSKRIYASELSQSGIPFYRTKDIIELLNGQEAPSSPLFIPAKRFQEILNLTGAPVQGDVLLTSRGTLGVPYLVKESNRFHFADGNLTWFRNFRYLDSRYLVYYFLSPVGMAELSKCVIGSSQAAYTIASLKNIEISLPPLAVQRSIAGILAAYDELIENNQRRIKILEEMARSLYREWFVHFRFPGHDKVKMLPSPLGPIPQGWEAIEMQEVADVIDCLHSKKPEECQEGSGVLLQLNNIGDCGKLDMQEQFRISANDYELWTSRIELQAGDCVVTNVGRVGAVAQIPDGVKAAPGRNMTAIRPRGGQLTPTFLIEYLLSSHMASEVAKKKDLGTIMDSLNVKGIIRLHVPCPPMDLMLKFESIARPMRKRVEVLVEQIQNLRRNRDLLLPRLLSGHLEIQDADLQVGKGQH